MDSSRAEQQLIQLQKLAKRRKANVVSISNERTQIQKNDFTNKLALKLDWTDTLYSREEIYSEYLYFLRNLPTLLHKEREKIIENVKKKLKISEIETDLPNFNKDNLIGIFFSQIIYFILYKFYKFR